MKKILDWEKYLEKATETVSEGIVMLKNENNALPINLNEEIAVFGRIQLHYYKSGTGSGGMVNVSKVVGIVDGLLENGVKLNERLLNVYREWDKSNPFDIGEGWGNEPWSQAEMPLENGLVDEISQTCRTAIVIIGRTAGEEQDNRLAEGSYLLSSIEKDMLEKVRASFEKVILLLNVGNIIDMEFIEKVCPDSVLYVWQGGMIGGKGTADVLTGKVSPSGKLPDTIAYSVNDYPSNPYFGDEKRNIYVEDIYVGYRYFETFSQNRVLYPFGFGLSYTKFQITKLSADVSKESIVLTVLVKNTGEYSGKEVVQLYCEAPQGKLGKPLRVLCGFEKTKTLLPGEEQILEIKSDFSDIASYDDSGVTGNRFCFVLEEGDYNFYIGNDVRNITFAYNVKLSELIVTRKCIQAMAPVNSFSRFRADLKEDGNIELKTEEVPISSVDENKRRLDNLPVEIPYTGDLGFKLSDVISGDCSMDAFIAQLSDYDLSCIIRGEGMGSPRVTPGTASAFGGVCDSLLDFGIPAVCCADGPSGMRLDCGTKAFSLPNGTLIASTFNKSLVEELYSFTGLEMIANKVDCLLGPGMNIHRHPLNGRNFEYFSEDPYLTGVMAISELKGLNSQGVTGTIKHFCGNNQETNRHFLDSVISERALREIYLKAFEMAVIKGGADSIMTTYGSVNGLWTAGNFDLNTIILRHEWGFDGFTMTDWWANINERGVEVSRNNFAAMAKAQNDIYMVCAEGGKNDDNTLQALKKGTLMRAELQRNAGNILRFIIGTNAMKRLICNEDTIEIINRCEDNSSMDETVVFYDLDKELVIDLGDINTEKNTTYSFALTVNNPGYYNVTLTASSELSELAQLPVTFFSMGTAQVTFTWNGTEGKPVSYAKTIPMFSHYTASRLYFAQSGLKMHSIKFELTDKKVDVSSL